MNPVLELLLQGERLSTGQMGTILGMSQVDIERELASMEQGKVLLGWRPVLNPAADADDTVRAVIEVRISPEREGGFDKLALRISRFDEVESCYLMSGAYDLLLVCSGRSLRQVASFVSERLSTIEGVLSTATHFLLRAYKEQGFLLVENPDAADKPAVSP